jgi:phosphoribosylaminoimidazole-succinocarboxamide synthase
LTLKIEIQNLCGEAGNQAVHGLVEDLLDLGFAACLAEGNERDPQAVQVAVGEQDGSAGERIVALKGEHSLLERTLRVLPLDFEALPLLVEGDSKILRLWTDRVVVERFKPTVYSYTMNRYGEAPETDRIRMSFSAELFRRMACLDPAATPCVPRSAFLAEIETPSGPLLVQRRIEPCNLEVRVKRYHIGSPVHRYLYTDKHGSTQSCGNIGRWSRFDQPVVCFDWRHPLHDEEGRRLADEPISDDYAAVWMENVPEAKEMARRAFLWMEETFAAAGVLLVDMCIFIDRSGRWIHGEISPDCMRVRLGLGDPAKAEAIDKDAWREGRSPEQVRDRYQLLHERIFGGR